ncbi:MAG: ABC transporter ATP-binding protein/permease [Lentisphaerae bacterium]|nr:ABC transporter ATP-binding protein/permease [Lentisphaerota bacterium]
MTSRQASAPGRGSIRARRRIMLGRGVTKRLRDDMHAHVIRLSLAAQSVHTPGRLMARILSDVNTVQEHMLTLVINASSNLLMVLAGLGLLWWVDWHMALMAVCIMPVYVIIYRTARPYLEQANREQRHTNACLYGLSSQKFDAVRLIQSSGREKHESLVFHRLIACYFRDGMYSSRAGAITSMLGQTISALGTNGAIFLFGVHRVLAGDITLGQMLYAYGTAASLFSPVLALSRMNMIFAHLMVSLQRLVEIMDEPNLIEEAPDARDINWPLRQSISVRNLGFSYAPDMPPVLRDVSLEVPAGTWTCIMGSSGSGKSTLLFLLGRLQDPQTGEILLDGISLKKVKLAALRRHVALVPQEPQILSGTVRDNVCYGRPLAEPDDIMAAARAAEFHDFVMTMPVKYETLLGEKGTSLSGGQRQRLSLARTLLTRPEILLLDDCTSALDAETEFRIQETLARVLHGKTAVMVSQRISMAQRCQQICVLHDGVISECGSPAELLAHGGYYARLHAQQTGQ